MLTGKYAGIGAIVRKHQKLDRVVIDEPYENMPAAEAGLKKGDVILSIDDSMMTDKEVNYLAEKPLKYNIKNVRNCRNSGSAVQG